MATVAWGVVVFVFLKHGVTRRMGVGCWHYFVVTLHHNGRRAVRLFVLLSECRHLQLCRYLSFASFLASRRIALSFDFCLSSALSDTTALVCFPSLLHRFGVGIHLRVFSFRFKYFQRILPRLIQASKLKAKRDAWLLYPPNSIHQIILILLQSRIIKIYAFYSSRQPITCSGHPCANKTLLFQSFFDSERARRERSESRLVRSRWRPHLDAWQNAGT